MTRTYASFSSTLVLFAVFAMACSASERGPGQWPLGKEELAGSQAVHPGDATYRRYCISCHGADGHGNGGVTGKDFVANRAALAAKSDSELATAVREGKRGENAVMPAHKPVLSDAKIDEVIAYVRGRFLSDRTQSP